MEEQENTDEKNELTRHAGQIKQLSFRAAKRLYHVSYETWRAIKDGERDSWRPDKRNGDQEGAQKRRERVLASVQELPHLNTQERAKRLGYSARDVQTILKDAGATKLNSRLQFAGYKVEVLRPLEVARQRRVVATRPGSLLHADFKTFGVVRGGESGAQRWIRGCIIIDSFTSYAIVHLCEHQETVDAIAAFDKWMRTAPIEACGFVLTDNGLCFTGGKWEEYLFDLGLQPRTTRSNHPWSNGKVEALNKTLKYQCFPAICTSESLSAETLELLTDRWMLYYNSHRVHTGHMNRGLPPLALYELWRKSPGDYVEKLVHLGLISLDEMSRVRYMGSSQRSAGEQRLREVTNGADPDDICSGQPLAFVVEGKSFSSYQPCDSLTFPPGETKANPEFRPAR